jgi:hypothetical protein
MFLLIESLRTRRCFHRTTRPGGVQTKRFLLYHGRTECGDDIDCHPTSGIPPLRIPSYEIGETGLYLDFELSD